jgi:hypothetical protein
MTYMHSHTAMTSAKPSQSRCPWVPGVRNGPRHTQDHSGILRGPLIHWMYTVGLLNHCMITPGHWVNSKSLHSTMTKLCFYLCKVLLSDTDRHTGDKPSMAGIPPTLGSVCDLRVRNDE